MIVRDSPVLSVIVVNYFSEENLARCLRSIAGASEPVEVIVADNGSAAGEQQALRANHPDLVWRPMGGNAGFGAASNTGAAHARSDKLLFLNPDTAVAPGSFGALAQALETPELADAILGCSIFDPDGAVQLSCRRFPSWKTFVSGRFSLLTRLFPSNGWSAEYLMWEFDHRQLRPVDWVSGAAMAMRKRTFDRLGGFDERYFLYFEDVDLCRRARREGIPVVYFPEARVEHLIGGSSRKAPFRALAHRHRSMWRYYRRYHGRLWLDPLAWMGIFGRLAVLCALQALSGLVVPAPAVRPAEDRRAG